MYPAKFIIAKNFQDYDNEHGAFLEFRAGSNERLYIKPEEIGRAVVSEPFEFDLSTVSDGHCWKESNTRIKFSDCLKNIIQPYYGTTEDVDSCQEMRLVVLCGLPKVSASVLSTGTDDEDEENEEEEEEYSADEEDEEEEYSEAEEEEEEYLEVDPDVPVPMKIKLISDSTVKKERSVLAKLANCFEHQNLRMILEEGGEEEVEPLQYSDSISFPSSVDLKWNQDEMAWEAETEVTLLTFENGFNDSFGKISCFFRAFFPKVSVVLSGASTISKLLNQQFGIHGNIQNALRTLEEEINTDLVIKDQDGNSVKCHRFPLMCASEQFVNMLNDTRDWKEASSRTINLDLSKQAIMAMLHFIYYGGTNRIVTGSTAQTLDLLQVGHMYELQNLVEVTSFVLMHKTVKSFTLDEGWELYRFSGGIMKLEKNSRWIALKNKGRDVVRNLRNWDKKCEKLKASELYQKLRPIAANLGRAFVAFLHKTPCPSNDVKALPINLKKVTMEDCKLFFGYLSTSFDYRSQDMDVALGFLLLVERIQYKPLANNRQHLQVLENLLDKKPSTWFKVDHLVALFTMSWKIRSPDPKRGKVMLDIARKLKWFLFNRPAEVLASKKYQKMFKKSWKCAMEFSKLCMQDSSI